MSGKLFGLGIAMLEYPYDVEDHEYEQAKGAVDCAYRIVDLYDLTMLRVAFIHAFNAFHASHLLPRGSLTRTACPCSGPCSCTIYTRVTYSSFTNVSV